MSIKTIIICDGENCEKKIEVDKPIFKFKDFLSEHGWTIKKNGDKWEHRCSDHK